MIKSVVSLERATSAFCICNDNTPKCTHANTNANRKYNALSLSFVFVSRDWGEAEIAVKTTHR